MLFRSNVSRDLEVQKYPPILSPEEEYNLAIELYEDGSLSAAQKLVLAHMRFVAFVAHGYKGYGLEQADLIQEVTIVLMKAVKRFNPHKKVRLSLCFCCSDLNNFPILENIFMNFSTNPVDSK